MSHFKRLLWFSKINLFHWRKKKKKKYFKWTPLFNALRNIKGEETSILNSEMRLAFKAHFWVWKQQSLFLEEEHYLLAWARYAIIIREIKSLSRDA